MLYNRHDNKVLGLYYGNYIKCVPMHGQTTSGIISKDIKWRNSKDTSNRPEVKKERKGIQSASLPFPECSTFHIRSNVQGSTKNKPLLI